MPSKYAHAADNWGLHRWVGAMPRFRLTPELIAKLPRASQIEEVAALLAEGKTAKEIGRALNRSEGGVKIRAWMVLRTLEELGIPHEPMPARRTKKARSKPE
jgi:hypothetical protein